MEFEWTPIRRGLLTLLLDKGPLTRRDIKRSTNLPWTTIYDNLLQLEKLNVVTRYKDSEHKNIGRPSVYWKINIVEEK